jgi:hypothetical protein
MGVGSMNDQIKRNTEGAPHACRACGRRFDGHRSFEKHWKLDHGYRRVCRCHMQCSFKMTYYEVQTDTVMYGEGVKHG